MKTNGSDKAKVMSTYSFVLSILMVLLLSACASQTSTPAPSQTTATQIPPTAVATPSVAPTPIGPDYWPTDGWRTSTPEEQGMDSELLAEALDFLQEQNGFNIHSLLIIRNGHVVTDSYFYPFAQSRSLHDLASATKSFTSSLIGIAIGQGYIESVGQPVLDFFPDRSVANVDANKEAMTVEDSLTMSSGLECSHSPPDKTTHEMVDSPDWVQFALDLPMAAEPGSRWVYCGPDSHLLSAIIQETSGMNALEFAQQHLFGPLGISDAIWSSDPQGYSHGWSNMILTPHDMAKLGYLYLNEGEWDGQQVLSTDWVTAATSPSPSNSDYGYQWYLRPSGYYANGAGGQRIFVFPDLDMVVVTTGDGGSEETVDAVLTPLLTSYILPAAESETLLPANPDGVALLESSIQQAAAAPQPEPVPPLPEIAQKVSGQTYVLEANTLGLLSTSLTFQEGEAEALLNLNFSDGNQAEWLIGLDNVYRISPGLYGLPKAAMGGWESDNVFVIHTDGMGKIRDQNRISMTFQDGLMTLGVAGTTLVGRLEE
jgi:CubicO group peptidase (beta-lactamase class C family)